MSNMSVKGGAALSPLGGLIGSNSGVNAPSIHSLPYQPLLTEAFLVPISMEDGSIKAVVVSEGGFSRRDEPRPLLSMEQAQSLVKVLNTELEQYREAERKRMVEMLQSKEFADQAAMTPQVRLERTPAQSLVDKLKDALK